MILAVDHRQSAHASKTAQGVIGKDAIYMLKRTCVSTEATTLNVFKRRITKGSISDWSFWPLAGNATYSHEEGKKNHSSIK